MDILEMSEKFFWFEWKTDSRYFLNEKRKQSMCDQWEEQVKIPNVNVLKINKCDCKPTLRHTVDQLLEKDAVVWRAKLDQDDFEIPELLADTLSCIIWLKLVNCHNNLQCLNWEHTFCSDWLWRILQQDIRCPNCRIEMSYDILTSSLTVKRLLNNLKIKEVKYSSKERCSAHDKETKAFCQNWKEWKCNLWLIDKNGCKLNQHFVVLNLEYYESQIVTQTSNTSKIQYYFDRYSNISSTYKQL